MNCAFSANTTLHLRTEGHLGLNKPGDPSPRQMFVASAKHAEVLWKGEDEYDSLDDRHDVAPLQLPCIDGPKRAVLVRHGQSTWNAERRIQGSSNFSVLTDKGESQAKTTHFMLAEDNFSSMFYSPLNRASKTAAIVWGDRLEPIRAIPSLREVDLYSFQGLLKAEGIQTYGVIFKQWQRRPAEFKIDGHHPVRELWHRASLAWQDILSDSDCGSRPLIVAHNAVNQALINTALGFPPATFRHLLQDNAASTVITFTPNENGIPHATLDALNQTPEPLFIDDLDDEAPCARLVLVDATKPGLQSRKITQLLGCLPVKRVLTSADASCVSTGEAVTREQLEKGNSEVEMSELRGLDVGHSELVDEQEANGASQVSTESESALWEASESSWKQARSMCLHDDGVVCVLADRIALIALLSHCLGLSHSQQKKFTMSPGGVTVIEFPNSSSSGIVRCHNYTTHLSEAEALV